MARRNRTTKTEVQNCLNQLRNSSKYVSYKDMKALIADLKAVYAQWTSQQHWTP
jgi:transposase-like protein